MPTPHEKLEAHSSMLLDAFIGLREKYAILGPMLFDQTVVQARGSGMQNHGFSILKNSLFFACSQDIANICCDSHKRVTSIKKLVAELENDDLRTSLCKKYSDRGEAIISGENDPAIIDIIRKSEQREIEHRHADFNARYEAMLQLWNGLEGSDVLEAFRTIRDKASAHIEVRFHEEEYRLIDIGALGLKWGDLRKTIESVQVLVASLDLLIRNSSFAWGMLDEQLLEAASSFWGVPHADR
ncbi:MAG: hypothetical protein ACSHXK_11365 [Oceanococcus sp.]